MRGRQDRRAPGFDPQELPAFGTALDPRPYSGEPLHEHRTRPGSQQWEFERWESHGGLGEAAVPASAGRCEEREAAAARGGGACGARAAADEEAALRSRERRRLTWLDEAAAEGAVVGRDLRSADADAPLLAFGSAGRCPSRSGAHVSAASAASALRGRGLRVAIDECTVSLQRTADATNDRVGLETRPWGGGAGAAM